jgi:hypothetical protein
MGVVLAVIVPPPEATAMKAAGALLVVDAGATERRVDGGGVKRGTKRCEAADSCDGDSMVHRIGRQICGGGVA